MQKLHYKSFIAGVLVTTFIGIGSFSYAQSITKTISAIYNNIKIVVDGSEINATDANGNKVEPFIYNGTIYLPVRAIGQAFGKSVSWDGKTQTVYVGGVFQEQYMSDIMKPYNGEAYINETMMVAGKSYTKGYSFRTDHIAFNLDGKYNQIKGLIGLPDDRLNEYGVIVEIYGDDKLIKTYDIAARSLPENFNVDVKGVLKLELKLKKHDDEWLNSFPSLINLTVN